MSTREAFLPLTARSRASVPADAATRSQDGISPFSVGSNVRSGRQSRTNATAGHEACKPAATAMTATSGTPSKMVNLIPARLCLVTVAFLYGTLNVCLRLIYARPDPPMASVISVIRGAIMILFFLPSLVRSLFLVGGDSSLAAAPRRRRQLCWTALELGFLNVAATGLLAVGVALTSSSVRASFLAQTSVVITPVLSVLAGERVKGSMWGGALLALVGVFVLATAGATVQDNGSVSSIDSGDMVMLACALSWSAYLFRFGRGSRSLRETRAPGGNGHDACNPVFGLVLHISCVPVHQGGLGSCAGHVAWQYRQGGVGPSPLLGSWVGRCGGISPTARAGCPDGVGEQHNSLQRTTLHWIMRLGNDGGANETYRKCRRDAHRGGRSGSIRCV